MRLFMTDFIAALALAFGVVLLVELPDKTLVATLVLSTRYRHRPVLVGVALAFAVQCVIAVAFGRLLNLLPHRALEAAVAVLFAVGAFLLLRESVGTSPGGEPPEHATPATLMPARRIAMTSFAVLFTAEWGDASQIATAGLVASRGQPIAVGLGAWLALTGVAALAVLAGKLILRRVPLRIVHRVAGLVFTVFAVVAAVAAIRG
jgi:putative Ca2+/H+ antiporter (TMEM165/GDT1 family)